MNWNLLTCALGGHVSYAPAEPEIRAQLHADTPAGETWQCLRCAAFVPGPPPLPPPPGVPLALPAEKVVAPAPVVIAPTP